MFVTLTEVVENTTTTSISTTGEQRFTLREVTINPKYVVCVREDHSMQRMLSEGLLPKELKGDHKFTRVYLDRGQTGIDVIVVGNPEAIEEKLLPKNKNRKVLNG